VVQGQFARDAKITGLVGVMKDVYSFVDAIQGNQEKVSILEDTILAILKQTVECSLFIQEYCGQGFQSCMLGSSLYAPIDQFTQDG
jgi:hypothetical protein